MDETYGLEERIVMALKTVYDRIGGHLRSSA
jgi:hypothetical protein